LGGGVPHPKYGGLALLQKIFLYMASNPVDFNAA